MYFIHMFLLEAVVSSLIPFPAAKQMPKEGLSIGTANSTSNET
jgi:hypothetical protein